MRAMLLYSIVEFITQTASSSAFIFCFCNLIIVIILMDLKPSLSFDQESQIPVSMVRIAGTTHEAEANSKCQAQKEETREGSREQQKEKEAADNCSNGEEDEEEVEEEEEDDELRRRVEEFIEKVNKGWKAELLSTSSLV